MKGGMTECLRREINRYPWNWTGQRKRSVRNCPEEADERKRLKDREWAGEDGKQDRTEQSMNKETRLVGHTVFFYERK